MILWKLSQFPRNSKEFFSLLQRETSQFQVLTNLQDKQESKGKGNSNFNKKLLGIKNDGAII